MQASSYPGAPAAAQPSQQYAGAASTEPYGSVSTAAQQTTNFPRTASYKQSSPVTKRRPSPYLLPNPHSTSQSSFGDASSSSLGGLAPERKKKYPHNTVVAIFLTPPLFVTLWDHASPYPLQCFLYLALALYAIDLANLREFYIPFCWISAIIMMTVSAVTAVIASREDVEAMPLVLVVMRTIMETLLFGCLACWGTLQPQWLHQGKQRVGVSNLAARMLHSLLVPLSPVLILGHAMPSLVLSWGIDVTTKGLPLAFALLMTLSMMTLGSVQNSGADFVVQTKMHTLLLLLGPPLVHLDTFLERIIMSNEWMDFILICTVPYLLLYLLHSLDACGSIPSPYKLNLLFGQASTSTLRGAILPIATSIVASIAAQRAYLIPACHFIAYQFKGHDLDADWIVSLELTGATLAALLSAWVAGRKSSITNELLFGEYHEDVVQLALALAGMLIGRAMGMQWSLTPLPILLILGLVLWLSTRMLRYLAMVLFVLHSTGMVIWSYRYAGISTMVTVLPGLELNLFRFGMLTVGVSALIFLAMGLVVRSSGGAGHKLLRRFDVAGVCLLVYTLLQTILECTLTKYPIPFKELLGIEVMDHPEQDVFLYKPVLVYMTSMIIGAICIFLQRYKIISGPTCIPILSLAIGKALAVFVDLHIARKVIKGDNSQDAAISLLFRTLAASLLLFVMLAPRAFLSQVRFKTSSRQSFKQDAPLPSSTSTMILAYAFFVLPASLFATIPWVIRPMVGILSGHFGSYYIMNPYASEIFGFVCGLWGIALLSTLNHLLPDGGGETWKKTAALTFLMGLGLAMAAPTVPELFIRSANKKVADPFASMSSLGAQLGRQSNHAGGWGLLAAAFATLLAVAGPLELRERNEGGQKDRFLLMRTMLFSILFGCGVSWFVTLESMSEEAFIPIFVTAAACNCMSFFGTVAAVLSFFLDLHEFEEAEQVVKVWLGAFPIFLATSSASMLARNVAHPFGMGGWLSTYLAVCGMITLCYSLVLRSRTNKNLRTVGIANSSCILSWLCWIMVLYGRYGVAGMDASYDLTTIFGIPASVFGTLVASLILLLVQDDATALKSTTGRGKRLSSSNTASGSNSGTSWLGLNLKTLSGSNQLGIPVLAISVVLTVASLYSILLRGAFTASSLSGGQHQEIYNTFFNGASEDLASLAEKNLLHLQAIQTSAQLAGGSFWTAKNPMGPLLHLAGVAATIPSLSGFIQYLWSGESSALMQLTVPLNIFPIIFCQSIPTLFCAAFLGLMGGIFQFFAVRGSRQQSNMRI